MSFLPVDNPTAPYWLQGAGWDSHRIFRSTPELPKRARVVIIGAGMTGMSCAFHLTENGVKDVCVVEARGISEEVAKFGMREVEKMQNFEIENINLMKNFIQQHDVKDAELTDTGGMHFAVDQEQLKDLTDYYERMEQLGLNADGHMVFWGPRLAKINSCCPKAQGGIYYRRVGQARPAYVVFKLCDLVHQRGGNVQTQTKVTKVSKQRSEGHKYVVHTNRGDIECEHVVYASNAFTSGLLPELKEIIVPTRGQMIVTSPLKNFELPMNVWINRGYEYLNQRPDGRLCAGGMRWKADGKESGVFDDSQVNKKVGEALRTMLVDYFPALRNENFTVDYEWTGVMAFSPDDNPLVGRWRDNEWIAAGFTGYGMPRTFHSGKYIADSICGKLKPDQIMKFYDPHRFDDAEYAKNKSKL